LKSRGDENEIGASAAGVHVGAQGFWARLGSVATMEQVSDFLLARAGKGVHRSPPLEGC
jgi:hypothetical protein